MCNRGLVLVFLLLTLSNQGCTQPVSNRNDNCLIYEKVLFFLNDEYGKTTHVSEVPPEGIDPMDTVFIDIPVQGKLAWTFLIVNSIYRFSPYAIEQWFAKDVGDTSLISMAFSKGERDTIINCRFDSSSIKYQFNDFFPPEDIWTNITEIEGTDTIHYSPLRLRFSDVLYSNEGFAVVNVQYTARSTKGRFEWMHCFVFQHINNKWILKREAQIVM